MHQPRPPSIAARSAEAFEILPGPADAGLVIVCDHASNALPPEYGTLGLPAAELERHIGYDIGAAGVVRHLAAALDAPAILSRFSRLLIDPNRGADDPTLVMRLSDGAIIPANRHLDDAERERRIARWYDPYHHAIAGALDTCIATRPVPAILSIHTFTPAWRGEERPWEVGILWDRDPRLAAALLAGYRADKCLTVGDNKPYTGKLLGDCMWRHGTRRGLAHAIIEIRQDLVTTRDGQQAWAARTAEIMRGIRAEASRWRLHAVEQHGSFTDRAGG